MFPPNEDASAAIWRMIEKMRGARAAARVDWGCEPLWQSTLPLSLYTGDTVLTFASFAEAPDSPPVLRWTIDEVEGQAPPATIRRTDEAAISRLAGAARMAEAATQEETEALAHKHQLFGAYNSLFLVHVRDEATGGDQPALQQVPQMMAAGHGGFGSVKRDPPYESPRLQSIIDSATKRPAPPQDSSQSRQRSVGPRVKKAAVTASLTPLQLLRAFDEGEFQRWEAELVLCGLMMRQDTFDLGNTLKRISDEENLPANLVWALLLDWLQNRFKDSFALSEKAREMLRELTWVQAQKGMAKARAIEALEREFSSATLEKWWP